MNTAGLGVADKKDVLGAEGERTRRPQFRHVRRKRGEHAECADRKNRACICRPHLKSPPVPYSQSPRLGRPLVPWTTTMPAAIPSKLTDRKSTRLNSSHLGI